MRAFFPNVGGMQPVAEQQKILRKILSANGNCSLFRQMGLERLNNFRDFDLLFQAFCRAVPVQSPKIWLDSLSKMLPQQNLAPLQVLQSPNLVVRGKPLAAVVWRGAPVPVQAAALEDYLQVEATLRARLQAQGACGSGLWFHLTEPEVQRRADVAGHLLPVPLMGWQELVDRQRNWLRRRWTQPRERVLPKGGSRWQWFNALHDQIKTHGKQIEVLITPPRTLLDFALYGSQQAGRFVPLREQMPNLKVLVFTHYDIALQRTELGFLLNGMPHVRWVQWLGNPGGLQMWQDDANIRQRLNLLTNGQTFYEFIPVEDADPAGRFIRTYRRMHVGQLEAGREYVLAVSALSGVLALSTGHIVKVLQTAPLQLMARGPVVQLHGLGENLREDALLEALGNINSAVSGHGVFIREALLGHVVAERQPMWLLEVSRPLAELPDGVLESIAKRLHSELELRSPGYREAFRKAAFRPAQVQFVPMGTFAAASSGGQTFGQFDHSPTAQECKKILAAAWESKMFLAV